MGTTTPGRPHAERLRYDLTEIVKDLTPDDLSWAPNPDAGTRSVKDILQVPLNEEWQGYFSVSALEPEELLRWIVRHEYHHLGQIITYQWHRWQNPNAKG